jgi:hypothetical protein
MDVPRSLRTWFVAHFVVDVVVGLPLLVAPGLLLHALGWQHVDPAASRLVGAAFLAIGITSLTARNQGLDVLRVLLDLKLLWSYGALIGLVIAAGQGAPSPVWALLSAFLAFAGIWTHYRIRMKQLAGAKDEEVEDPWPAS